MNQNQQNSISHFLDKAEHMILLLLFFSVPIFPKGTTILIILYIAISLINYKKIYLANLGSHKSLLLLILIYLILILGLVYTSDIKSGLGKIQTQVSFLVFPLFLGTKTISKENRNKYLIVFVLGVLATVIICLGNGVYRLLSNGNMYVLDELSRKNNIFFYEEFSWFLDLHPTYFSLYIGMAFYCLIELPIAFILKRPILKWCIALLLLFALVLTSSKGGIFSFVICSVIYIIYVSINEKRKNFVIKLLIIGTAAITIFLINPVLYKRSKQLLVSFDKVWIKNEQPNESSAIRFGLWKLSAEVSKEAMLFGHGTGSVYKTLNDNCIYLFSFSICENLRNKNSHNQYLDFLVSNGLLILIPFLLIMVKSVLESFKNRDGLLLFFIVFMGLNLMFESLLQRERGVIFFTMFLILLLISNKTNKASARIKRFKFKRNRTLL